MYDYANFQSSDQTSDEGLFPKNYLTMKHSLGYNSGRKRNLCVLGPENIGYIAGNYFISINLKTNEKIYVRSSSGMGMSCLAPHQTNKYLAIGETGDGPVINIFCHNEGSEFTLNKRLCHGALKQYKCMNFNNKGNLLASVAGDPDYMLTLWNWENETIMLRSKAFSQDIFHISFSSELEGQLTTSGVSHIKFWKMASTFTGLKLQGELGRFGKTEISDIDGYLQLPDGKVLSGCEWGNMLLWDGSLIKVEIGRKNGTTCHNGKIMQIIMDEGELITVGLDGYIKVWDFEKIDSADVSDNIVVFEMEPMNEMMVNKHAKIIHIEKSINSSEQSIWYAQDCNGGIWKLDLSFSFTSIKPDKIYSHHAGAINACCTSPTSYHVATIASDGSVRVYDVEKGILIAETFSSSPGTSILWNDFNEIYDDVCISCGYEDGLFRCFTMNCDKDDTKKKNISVNHLKMELKLIYVSKPHTSRINHISRSEDLQTTTCSLDHTIFLFKVADRQLITVGYIKTPHVVNFMDWNRHKILGSCENATILKISDIKLTQIDTTHSFCINEWVKLEKQTFTSIKSTFLHEIEVKNRQELKEERLIQKEKENQKMRDLGIEVEEDQESVDTTDEWSEYIPSQPGTIMFGVWDQMSFDEDYFISVSGFDCGFVYKRTFNVEKNKRNLQNAEIYSGSEPILITNALDNCITCFKEIDSMVYLGMNDGSIRVQKNLFKNFTNENYWAMSVHCSLTGSISQIATTVDAKYVVTVGEDGNIFVYQQSQQALVAASNKVVVDESDEMIKAGSDVVIDDIDNPNHYSIEEGKQRSQHDLMVFEANKLKEETINKIAEMRESFNKIKQQNLLLPETHRLAGERLEMDPEIRADLFKDHEDQLKTQEKIMAWEAERCRLLYYKLKKTYEDYVENKLQYLSSTDNSFGLYNYRIQKISQNILNTIMKLNKGLFQRQSTLGNLGMDTMSTQNSMSKIAESNENAPPPDNSIKTDILKANFKGAVRDRLVKAIKVFNNKEEKRRLRKMEWDNLYAKKTTMSMDNPQDVEDIKNSELNAGDYKLKSSENYIVPDHLRMTTIKARSRLIEISNMLNKKKKRFNVYFDYLKCEKTNVVTFENKVIQRLTEIDQEITKNVDIEIDEGEKRNMTHKSLETKYYKYEVLKYEKERLQEKVTKTTKFFNDKVSKLSIIKGQVDMEIKLAELRFITLYQELCLLKEFEKQENDITNNLETELVQLSINKDKILELELNLDEKKIEIDAILEKEKILNTNFQNEVSKEGKFTDFLTKVFKKKVKIKSKQENMDDTDNEEETSDYYDSEMSMSLSEESDSDEDQGYDLDTCPIGCNHVVYESVLKLRTTRMEIDEKMVEEKKTRETQIKELESLNKKQINIKANLRSIEKKLEDFQLEKQRNVNELKIVAVLSLDQLQYIDEENKSDYILPNDLSQCLVFDTKNIQQLQKRVLELDQEKLMEKKNQNECKKKHLSLIRMCKQLTNNIESVTKEYNKMMLEKFGKRVSLTKLDKVMLNYNVEELKQKLREQDCKNDNEIFKMKNDIDDQKIIMTKTTIDNTELLKQFNSLIKLKRRYEESLNNEQKLLGSEYSSGDNQKERGEQNRLTQLVKMQLSEINRLKEEILILSQKGGHVLPPVDTESKIKSNSQEMYPPPVGPTSLEKFESEVMKNTPRVV